ncbi:hypothetical protein N0V94_004214 [Neodidymelliopsis sp. IMI 364377]|nr:hypothetical protein N0V94_004214 [Neodidymelliopsis sp. IMI 364377]
MTRAEKVLMLSDPAAFVEFGPAGPELLIAVLLQNVRKRALLDGEDQGINTLYHKYASGLEYQISQFPRRRLLHEIHILQEELNVVQGVNGYQQQCLRRLMDVLDPRSFVKPTQDRIATYPAEHAALEGSLQELNAEAAEFEALEDRTQFLRNQLRQSVEILEEDHGKAIFVFTMVTTIFLPLYYPHLCWLADMARH